MSVVPIPEALMRMETRPLLSPSLLDEIEDWCRGQLVGGFSIKWVPMTDRVNYSNAFEIKFDNDSDAVLFKMRWM